jgi:hypothetical protein
MRYVFTFCSTTDDNFRGMIFMRSRTRELLYARVWQRSLEGELEPVFYMGVARGLHPQILGQTTDRTASGLEARPLQDRWRQCERRDARRRVRFDRGAAP